MGEWLVVFWQRRTERVKEEEKVSRVTGGENVKCFTLFSSVKHFSFGFSFNWKYFTVDQLFYHKTNIIKCENILL